MDIRQLSCFLSVADTGSYTAAAKVMYMSQPGLFKAIRTLEDELGAALFVQQDRKTTLSDVGREIYPKAKQLLALFHEIQDVADAHTPSRGGVINASCFVVKQEDRYRFIFGLQQFMALHPDAIVNLSLASSHEIRNRLLSGETDVALCAFYENESQEGLELLPLVEERYCCVVHRDHPLAGAGEIHFADLAKQKLITPKAESSVAPYVGKTVEMLWQALPDRPQIIYTESRDLVSAYLNHNSAVFLSPWSDGSFIADAPELVEVRICDFDFPHTVAYARKRRAAPWPRLDELWDILKREAEQFRQAGAGNKVLK